METPLKIPPGYSKDKYLNMPYKLRKEYLKNVILKLLEINTDKYPDGLQLYQIVEALGLSKTTIQRILDELEDSKRVYVVKSGGIKKYFPNSKLRHSIYSSQYYDEILNKLIRFNVIEHPLNKTYVLIIEEIGNIKENNPKILGTIEISLDYLDTFIQHIQTLKSRLSYLIKSHDDVKRNIQPNI